MGPFVSATFGIGPARDERTCRWLNNWSSVSDHPRVAGSDRLGGDDPDYVVRKSSLFLTPTGRYCRGDQSMSGVVGGLRDSDHGLSSLES